MHLRDSILGEFALFTFSYHSSTSILPVFEALDPVVKLALAAELVRTQGQ